MSTINLIELPNGIYKIDKNGIKKTTEITLSKNEKALVFFLNRRCIHCITLTPEIEGLIKYLNREKRKTQIILVLCDWFTEECTDKNAKKLFEKYNIDSTPTILLLEKKENYTDKTYIDPHNIQQIKNLL